MNNDRLENERKNGKITDESAFAENVIAAGRNVYSSNQSSPSEGCKALSEMREIISANRLPDDKMLEHLFKCSACFNTFQQLKGLSERTGEQKITVVWWKSLFNFSQHELAWTAAGLALVLVVFLSLVWLLRGENAAIELARNSEISGPKNLLEVSNSTKAGNEAGQTSTDQQNANSKTPTEENKILSPGKEKVIRNDNDDPAEKTDNVNVILTENQILRSRNDSKNEKSDKVLLPSKTVNLNIELPQNFSVGLYTVKLVDAFNNTLSEQRVRLKNRHLTVRFDLKKWQSRASKLCLQTNDEVPDCFDIQIKD